MLVCYGFLFKTFDMYKTAVIIMRCVTLTAHAARSIFVEGLKIIINYLLRGVLCALGHSKRHELPYHTVCCFGLASRLCKVWAIMSLKMLHH